MKLDEQLANEVAQLTPEHLKYMTELVFLLRFCPEFNAEVDQVIPGGCKKVSMEQIAEIGALMDKWLYKKGWEDILHSKLESMKVCSGTTKEGDAE